MKIPMMDNIRFKDTEATLRSFHYMENYNVCLEGHPMYISWRLLKETWNQLNKEEGIVFVHNGEVMSPDRLNEIEQFENERAIMEYVRELRNGHAGENQDYPSKPLKDIIETISKSIEYKKYCKFFGIDNI